MKLRPTPFESLQRYGTIAFSFSYMMEMIKFGRFDWKKMEWNHDSNAIELGLWLSFVPEVYINEVIVFIPSLEQFLFSLANEETREIMVLTLLNEIWTNVSPINSVARTKKPEPHRNQDKQNDRDNKVTLVSSPYSVRIEDPKKLLQEKRGEICRLISRLIKSLR